MISLFSPWLGLLLLLTGHAALAGWLPGDLRLLAAPALLWAPGAGWARQGDPLDRLLSAALISGLIAAISVAVARETGTGPPGVLACAGVGWALGHLRPASAGYRAAPRSAGRWGAPLAALGLLALIPLHPAFLRPLADHGWHDITETEDFGAALPQPLDGWLPDTPADRAPVEGVTCLRPAARAATLDGSGSGTALLLFQGPIQAGIGLPGAASGAEFAWVERDVTEDIAEGPVQRYQTAGALLRPLPLSADGITLRFTQPADSRVCLIASPVALWDLHAAGRFRVVQYYQLLNMVEQLRWAQELLHRRTVTDIQPPGWSWLLAAVTALCGDDLPAANTAMLLCLGLGGIASLRLLRAWGGSPPPLLLLPLAAAVHARLLLEPGSAGMPDTLYAVLTVAALSALPDPAAPGFARLALLAQLMRYPATGLSLALALLAARPRAALRALFTVLAAAAAFGLYGLWSDQLSGWLLTVAWESGPEHWHGDHDPALLLSRAPAFYARWLRYAGGTPLLALAGIGLALHGTGWRGLRETDKNLPLRGAAVCMGAALLYSLLLCTIDHHPSHYFLPLLHLSALACALLPAADARLQGWGWLAAAGLAVSWMAVPVE